MISDELNEYIIEITMNFIENAHGIRKIVNAENNRQKLIKEEVIALVKLYKGMELSVKEEELLKDHPMQYDYMTDLKRCIYQVTYEVSDKTGEKILNIQRDNLYKFDGKTYGIYHEYLQVLEGYKNSLLHAMCFNHELVLINPDKNEIIRPDMDFNSNCFIQEKRDYPKRLFLKNKRTLN